jgi:hypothetical protein
VLATDGSSHRWTAADTRHVRNPGAGTGAPADQDTDLSGRPPHRRGLTVARAWWAHKKKAFRPTQLVGTPSNIQVASAGQRLLPGTLDILHSVCRKLQNEQLVLISFYFNALDHSASD